MHDPVTNQRIEVGPDTGGGAYILVRVTQLEAVETVLRRQQIAYYLDAETVSTNGKPPATVVNLPRGADERRIQQMIDDIR